jgi:hypothetical protein
LFFFRTFLYLSILSRSFLINLVYCLSSTFHDSTQYFVLFCFVKMRFKEHEINHILWLILKEICEDLLLWTLKKKYLYFAFFLFSILCCALLVKQRNRLMCNACSENNMILWITTQQNIINKTLMHIYMILK